ncbi:purine-nucleoside phosphorylase [bacterium]|nr:purine-nucleoside phosphorylase [bacterium]
MIENSFDEILDFLHSKRIAEDCSFSVITGSGLAGAVNKFAEIIQRFKYTELPSFPVPTVIGHTGELLVVKLMNSNILALVFSGRTHLYEGVNINNILFQVRLANLLNINKIFITCAVGSLTENSKPGELGLLSNHIDFQLLAVNRLSQVSHRSIYDKNLCAKIYEIALNERIPIRKGTLCSILGPTYETWAEAGMARFMGADWMSMSTAKEAAEASRLGMSVVGISGVTNFVNDNGISHDSVINSAKESSENLWRLIYAYGRSLANE